MHSVQFFNQRSIATALHGSALKHFYYVICYELYSGSYFTIASCSLYALTYFYRFRWETSEPLPVSQYRIMNLHRAQLSCIITTRAINFDYNNIFNAVCGRNGFQICRLYWSVFCCPLAGDRTETRFLLVK